MLMSIVSRSVTVQYFKRQIAEDPNLPHQHPPPVNEITPSPPGSHSWTFKPRIVPSGRPPEPICHNESLPISRDLLSPSHVSSRDVLFFLRTDLPHSPIYLWHDPSPIPTHGRGECVLSYFLFPQIMPLRRYCNQIDLFLGMVPSVFWWMTKMADTVISINLYYPPNKQKTGPLN